MSFWNEDETIPPGANEIRDVDLSPFSIRSLTVTTKKAGTRLLRFRHPLILTPVMDETSQLFCLRHPEYSIDVFAETREEVLSELYEQIVMLWEEYALEDDAKLAPDARRLKAILLQAIEDAEPGDRPERDHGTTASGAARVLLKGPGEGWHG